MGPGDELVLRGWGQIDINYHGFVDRSGNLFVPTVGDVSVAGVAFKDLQPILKTAIGRYYKGFELNVSMGQLRSIQVFVTGQARQPGAPQVRLEQTRRRPQELHRQRRRQAGLDSSVAPLNQW